MKHEGPYHVPDGTPHPQHAPSGTVQLLVDGRPAGRMRLNHEGKATFDVAGLAAGTHELVAVYPEQEGWGESKSPAVSITVV